MKPFLLSGSSNYTLRLPKDAPAEEQVVLEFRHLPLGKRIHYLKEIQQLGAENQAKIFSLLGESLLTDSLVGWQNMVREGSVAQVPFSLEEISWLPMDVAGEAISRILQDVLGVREEDLQVQETPSSKKVLN